MAENLRKDEARALSKQEDLTLISRALENDQSAYQSLMKKYQRLVQNLVYKMISNKDDVEDLTQEAFIKAFNSLEKFDREYAFSTWLYKIASNNCIDYLRKKKLNTFSIDKEISQSDEDLRFEIPDEDFKPDRDIMQNQRTIFLQKAIDSLPAKYKQVILLRHKDEMEYEEIAKALGVPIGTVKAHLFRARELLNRYLRNKIQHY